MDMRGIQVEQENKRVTGNYEQQTKGKINKKVKGKWQL